MPRNYKKKTDVQYATKDNPFSPSRQKKYEKACEQLLNPKTGKNGQILPQQYRLEGDKTSQILNNMKELYMSPKLKTIEEMYARLDWYFFDYSPRLNMKPTLAGAAMSIGVGEDVMSNWLRHESGEEKYQVAKRAKDCVKMFMEVATMSGELNPIVWMFYGKNYFGMSDKQEMVLTPNRGEDAPDVKAIQERLQSMPTMSLPEGNE